jgi:HK97 family phage major capsid protein
MDVELKSALDSISGTVQAFKAEQTAMQKQLDVIDLRSQDRHVGGSLGGAELLKKTLQENESVAALLHNRRGRAIVSFKDFNPFERKSTITGTGLGFATSGVMMFDRTPGIVEEARQELTVRDVLSARPTTLGLIDFVKVNSPMSIASPQVEASSKFENAFTLTTHSEKVRTLATYIRASTQVLDDYDELGNFIGTSLSYYVNIAEELQLLAGSGSGENLNGLITQATSFNSALLLSGLAGWNTIDIVGRAIQQLAIAKELKPTFIILNPTDWADMRLLKDGFGHYILGDPQSNVAPSLFGLRVVSTTSISANSFLLGSGSPVASEIRDRMETTIDISTEDADNFTKNLVTIRAEKRLALVVKRPASYIYGTFTSSPA